MAIDSEPVTFVRKGNEKPAKAQGETLITILSRDRELAANVTEVWRAQYSVDSLPGWQGQTVMVSASLIRDGRDTLLFGMTVPGHLFSQPGLWSPLDALAWFGLDASDKAIWRRDPEEEARFIEGEKRRKSGVYVPANGRSPFIAND